MNRKKWRWVVVPVLAAGVVWWAIPDYGGDLENFRAVVKIRDCNGQPLRTTLGDGDIFCDPVPLDQTGDWTVKALIAAEDKRFFRHGGIDSIAVGRAQGVSPLILVFLYFPDTPVVVPKIHAL